MLLSVRVLPLSLRVPGLLSWALAGLLAAPAARSEPVDLREPLPRWVAASFERSPDAHPGVLDADYGPWIPAWLAPEASREPRVRITVAGSLVERHLFEGQSPRPGTFSDYTLLMDVATGHVLEAVFTGVVVRHLHIGFLRLASEVELRASMSTLSAAGFEPPRKLLGEVIFGHCHGHGGDCTLVRPVPYDPRTGYANAVGLLEGRTRALRVRLFSPLGKFRLREMAPEELESSFAVAP